MKKFDTFGASYFLVVAHIPPEGDPPPLRRGMCPVPSLSFNAHSGLQQALSFFVSASPAGEILRAVHSEPAEGGPGRKSCLKLRGRAVEVQVYGVGLSLNIELGTGEVCVKMNRC